MCPPEKKQAPPWTKLSAPLKEKQRPPEKSDPLANLPPLTKSVTWDTGCPPICLAQNSFFLFKGQNGQTQALLAQLRRNDQRRGTHSLSLPTDLIEWKNKCLRLSTFCNFQTPLTLLTYSAMGATWQALNYCSLDYILQKCINWCDIKSHKLIPLKMQTQIYNKLLHRHCW